MTKQKELSAAQLKKKSASIDEFASAVGNASNTSGFIKDACAAASKWFGDRDVPVAEMSEYAAGVCEKRGYENGPTKAKKDIFKSWMTRYRKVIRHRVAMPGIIDAIMADKRYGGSFTLHEGFRLGTILNADPKMSTPKAVNAYFAKKKDGVKATLSGDIQKLCDKAKGMKGRCKKGSDNETLIDNLLIDFEDAGYNVE